MEDLLEKYKATQRKLWVAKAEENSEKEQALEEELKNVEWAIKPHILKSLIETNPKELCRLEGHIKRKNITGIKFFCLRCHGLFPIKLNTKEIFIRI